MLLLAVFIRVYSEGAFMAFRHGVLIYHCRQGEFKLLISMCPPHLRGPFQAVRHKI